MSKASSEALEALHSALANVLAARLQSGEATAADLGVARQFLKDNYINSAPTQDDALSRIRDALPFPTPAEAASEFMN